MSPTLHLQVCFADLIWVRQYLPGRSAVLALLLWNGTANDPALQLGLQYRPTQYIFEKGERVWTTNAVPQPVNLQTLFAPYLSGPFAYYVVSHPYNSDSAPNPVRSKFRQAMLSVLTNCICIAGLSHNTAVCLPPPSLPLHKLTYFRVVGYTIQTFSHISQDSRGDGDTAVQQ
jgi:hypothetical protein